MSSRWIRGLGIGLLAIVMLLALAVPTLGDTYVTRARADSWDPRTQHLARGDRVKFRNVSSRDHNVTGYDGWDYRHALPEGESFRKRFRRRGTFKFLCTIHGDLNGGVCEGMCGKVLVH